MYLVPTFDDNDLLIWDHVKLDAKSDLVSQSVNHSVLVVSLDWWTLTSTLLEFHGKKSLETV